MKNSLSDKSIRQPENPFVVHGYVSAAYFCDRAEETVRLLEAINNGRNVTLISARRKGKSSLVKHVLAQGNYATIFSDLFKITSFNALTQRLASDIVKSVGVPKKSFLQNLARVLASFRVGMGYDSITGSPEVTVSLQPQADEAKALEELFKFLSQSEKQVVWAIDEMQQVTAFADGSAEALLREMAQAYPSIRFLYAGSNRTLMTDIFTNSKRPFYQSSDLLFLENIPRKEYIPFVHGHLQRGKRTMDDQLISDCMDWCMGETYFIQRLFNRLYGNGRKKIDARAVQGTQQKILEEKNTEYQVLLNLFSSNQQKLLIALAREKRVAAPTAADFIKRHDLSAPSTVSQSLKALIEKDFVHQEEDGYQLADAFFMHWLRKE